MLISTWYLDFIQLQGIQLFNFLSFFPKDNKLQDYNTRNNFTKPTCAIAKD